MNVLDENIPGLQRRILRTWRIPIRHIGYDLEQKGVKDPNIITYLHRIRRPTLFTLDKDFYDRDLCHRSYCLVMLAVRDDAVAEYVRRLLRHPSFNTQAKRMGSVIRVSPTGLMVWRLHAQAEEQIPWTA